MEYEYKLLPKAATAEFVGRFKDASEASDTWLALKGGKHIQVVVNNTTTVYSPWYTELKVQIEKRFPGWVPPATNDYSSASITVV